MITSEERAAALDLARDMTSAILDAALPAIRKTFPGLVHSVTIDGVPSAEAAAFLDLAPGVLQAYDDPGRRDYRKQLWVATYGDWYATSSEEAISRANAAVKAFDEAFPA